MKEFFVGLMVGLVVGAVTALLWREPDVIERVEIKTEYVDRWDTVYVNQIKWKYLPGKVDTITLESGEKNAVASARKVVAGDTVYVLYRFPPINDFDVALSLAPRAVQVRDKIITKETVIRAGYPFIKGLFVRMGVYTGFGEGVFDMGSKIYPVSMGITFQSYEFMADLSFGGVVYPVRDAYNHNVGEFAGGWGLDARWYFLK